MQKNYAFIDNVIGQQGMMNAIVSLKVMKMPHHSSIFFHWRGNDVAFMLKYGSEEDWRN